MTIFDLYVEKGSTFTQSLGLGQDLTGYTINSSCKDSVGTMTTGIVAFTDIATGAIKIDLTALQTSQMAKGVGYYDVELTETATGSVSKPLKGRIYVDGEVTV